VTYRPYPSAARARHQLARHARREEAPAVVSPTTVRLADGLREAFQPNYECVLESFKAITKVMPRAADCAPAAARSGPGSGA
jgi:hypothetical protein